MLEDVRIRGLGVIEDATLPLGPGLSVVTGETGAGKTMVVSGLLLLFGDRSDASAVSGDAADIEGRLRLAADHPAVVRAADAGGDLDDDGSLILSRSVSSGGRSRATVGGRSVPVGVLSDISASVLAVHGQSAQLRLRSAVQQREVLDRYAGADLAAARERYAAAYAEWQGAVAELADRRTHQAERRREADSLTYALEQVDAAEPQVGEDERLTVEVARLSGADALRVAATTAHAALVGDDADPDAATVGDLVGTARRALEPETADPELAALADRVRELGYLAADVGADLASYATGLDDDPDRLAAAMDRRALLTGLVQRYADGTTVADLLAWAEAARARLADLDTSDGALAALEQRAAAARAEAATHGSRLRALRTAAAERFAAAVGVELRGLAMGGASLHASVRPKPPVGPTVEVDGQACGAGPDGLDEVAFELASYDGDTPRPLGRGASGGELSRIMLAVEVVLAGADPVPTMIFDEVDAGVGGAAAVEIGRRLAALGRDHQVIAVTHLPQVAAYADRHIAVRKSKAGAVVRSGVEVLDEEARVAELTRMLAGLADSDSGKAHARELLETAAADKRAPARKAAKPRKARRSA